MHIQCVLLELQLECVEKYKTKAFDNKIKRIGHFTMVEDVRIALKNYVEQPIIVFPSELIDRPLGSLNESMIAKIRDLVKIHHSEAMWECGRILIGSWDDDVKKMNME